MEGGAHEEPDDHEDGHHHDGLDPHAWQSLTNGVIYARNIRDGLCAADTAGCATYTANAEAYVAELTALDQAVRNEIAAIPQARRKVISSHDAFRLFRRRLWRHLPLARRHEHRSLICPPPTRRAANDPDLQSKYASRRCSSRT